MEMSACVLSICVEGLKRRVDVSFVRERMNSNKYSLKVMYYTQNPLKITRAFVLDGAKNDGAKGLEACIVCRACSCRDCRMLKLGKDACLACKEGNMDMTPRSRGRVRMEDESRGVSLMVPEADATWKRQ
jgi:hypothetical protein